jgi:pseudouridine-5'-phosphate glycosidase
MMGDGSGNSLTLAVRDRLRLSDAVAAALRDGTPVVALESTLITHGLPYPANLDVARAAEAAVRAAGVVPATIAIHERSLLVGLSDEDLEALASAPAGSTRKASRPTLASSLMDGGWAGTTVSATMIAAHAAGIRVFATGGIGGVHTGAIGGDRPTLDISSDLEELARTPVAVVCAGPKAILDVPATIEYLETRGVPVVVIGQDEVPGFFSRRSGVAAPASVGDLPQTASIVRTHLELGLGGGVLVCVPVPEADALPENVAHAAIERASREAAAGEVVGPALTPFLLGRIAELTGGASVRANTALIVNNARAAAELARLLV